MTIHRDIIQRSDAWYAIRCGKFTASDFDTLMPSSRQKETDWNETQLKIIYRVAAERMTGLAKEQSWDSKPADWGREKEDEARFAYELETGNEVEQVGFIELDDWIGCSPDGLIREDGYWEAKCPNSDTHLRYSLAPHELEENYGWQVMGGLWISGRTWAHIVSYDPRFKDEKKQLVIWSITRDEEAISRLSSRLSLAVEKAKEIIGG